MNSVVETDLAHGARGGGYFNQQYDSDLGDAVRELKKVREALEGWLENEKV